MNSSTFSNTYLSRWFPSLTKRQRKQISSQSVWSYSKFQVELCVNHRKGEDINVMPRKRFRRIDAVWGNPWDSHDKGLFMRSLDIYFVVSHKELLKKQPSCWWFDTRGRPCDVIVMVKMLRCSTACWINKRMRVQISICTKHIQTTEWKHWCNHIVSV